MTPVPWPAWWTRYAKWGPPARSPRWPYRAAAHASLDDPNAVAFLMRTLRELGATGQLTALADRNPAARTNLDDLVRACPACWTRYAKREPEHRRRG